MSDAPAFLGAQAAPEGAKFWVIPASLETTADFVTGQAAAPEMILSASAHVSAYDEEVGIDVVSQAAVHTAAVTGAPSLEKLEGIVTSAIDAGATPIIIGGAPVVTLAGIRALASKVEEFTILHISARAQLRDGSGGRKDSCASVMRRATEIENMKRVVQVGVRAVFPEEADLVLTETDKVQCFFASDLARSEDDSWQEDVITELSTPVYVSLDLSGLDRSVVNTVGVPEPGGLLWWDLLRLLKKVAGRRRIAAFDVVDLTPFEGDVNGPYAAARLACKTMAYMLAGGKMIQGDAE